MGSNVEDDIGYYQLLFLGYPNGDLLIASCDIRERTEDNPAGFTLMAKIDTDGIEAFIDNIRQASRYGDEEHLFFHRMMTVADMKAWQTTGELPLGWMNK